MAGRILPVRDRVVSAIQKQLRTIQTTNGYAHSLTGVYRRPGNAWQAVAPPEAYLYFGRAQNTERAGTQDRVYERLSMQVRAFASSLEDDVDRDASILLADMQKCLATVNEPLKDGFHPHSEIWLVPKGNMVGYPPQGSGYVVSVAWWDVVYWYVASNPNRWDDLDRDVYEEDLVP